MVYASDAIRHHGTVRLPGRGHRPDNGWKPGGGGSWASVNGQHNRVVSWLQSRSSEAATVSARRSGLGLVAVAGKPAVHRQALRILGSSWRAGTRLRVLGQVTSGSDKDPSEDLVAVFRNPAVMPAPCTCGRRAWARLPAGRIPGWPASFRVHGGAAGRDRYLGGGHHGSRFALPPVRVPGRVEREAAGARCPRLRSKGHGSWYFSADLACAENLIRAGEGCDARRPVLGSGSCGSVRRGNGRGEAVVAA
jgi:hypothetical protein